MYYEETEKLNIFFKIAIVLIVIVGFIGGICLGFALEGPTAKALQAMDDIIKYPSIADDMGWHDIATQTRWTFASVGAMLGTWICTAIAVLLLYAKKCQIEIMDDMVGILKNIENPETTKEEKEE